MNEYLVVKNFGHFTQTWAVSANSEEEAWEKAELNGILQHQIVYRDLKDIDSKGYVVNLSKRREKEPAISTEQYYGWMKEAIEKGMTVSEEQYKRAMQ